MYSQQLYPHHNLPSDSSPSKSRNKIKNISPKVYESQTSHTHEIDIDEDTNSASEHSPTPPSYSSTVSESDSVPQNKFIEHTPNVRPSMYKSKSANVDPMSSSSPSLKKSTNASQTTPSKKPPPVPQKVINQYKKHSLDFFIDTKENEDVPVVNKHFKGPNPMSPSARSESESFIDSEYVRKTKPIVKLEMRDRKQAITATHNRRSHKKSNSTFNFKKKTQQRPKSSRLSLSYKHRVKKPAKRRASVSISASHFNSVNIVENIETYCVIFESRVCGIELIPFDEDSNLGAICIKNHTEFSKKYVELQSLLVAINGQSCIDTDYNDILTQISTSDRPLTLKFHPPNIDKNEMIDSFSRQHKISDLRPSEAMKLNDEEDGLDNMEMNKICSPNKLFKDKSNNDKNVEKIRRNYTILYHKHCELKQFQKLTQQTVIDKMSDIKRITAENMSLRSELHRVQTEQYKEYKEKQLMDNYQLLNHKHLQMEKQNIAQRELIISLQTELKQANIKINQLKKKQKMIKISTKKRSKSPSAKKKKKKNLKTMSMKFDNDKRTKSKSPISHKKSYSVAVENKLQSELVTKLNKMNGTNIKIIKQSDNKMPFKTPPPPNTVSSPRRSGSRGKKRKKNTMPIALLTPSSMSLENVRSKSTDIPKRNRSGSKKSKKRMKKPQKKRQSAIGAMFKKFSSKGKSGSEFVSTEKYDPEITEIVKDKNKKNNAKRVKTKKKTSEDLINLNKRRISNKVVSNEKVRSNSLELNNSNSRKKTIV